MVLSGMGQLVEFTDTMDIYSLFSTSYFLGRSCSEQKNSKKDAHYQSRTDPLVMSEILVTRS